MRSTVLPDPREQPPPADLGGIEPEPPTSVRVSGKVLEGVPRLAGRPGAGVAVGLRRRCFWFSPLLRVLCETSAVGRHTRVTGQLRGRAEYVTALVKAGPGFNSETAVTSAGLKEQGVEEDLY